jgi:hypothetical protein
MRWGHIIMNWRLSVAAIAALIALDGTARADTLTSGPGDAGPSQSGGVVVCRLFNAGSSAATISAREIWSSFTGKVAPSHDECTGRLAGQKFCQYFVAPATRATYVCRAVTSGVEEEIRGTMLIFGSTGQLLLSLPMEK